MSEKKAEKILECARGVNQEILKCRHQYEEWKNLIGGLEELPETHKSLENVLKNIDFRLSVLINKRLMAEYFISELILEEEQIALRKYIFDDLPFSEIAAQMKWCEDCAEDTVKSAMDEIREMLNEPIQHPDSYISRKEKMHLNEDAPDYAETQEETA